MGLLSWPREIVAQGELLEGLMLKGGHILWIALLLFILDSQMHFTGVNHTWEAGGCKHEVSE